MEVRIHKSWQKYLQKEFDSAYFQELTKFVKSEYSRKAIYPPAPLIFNAFNLTPFDSVKVVLIGQDPYHGAGQAHGLAFSVKKGIPKPPSLQNIFKEIKSDIGTDIPIDGDLTRWAKQGVFMLNTVLTVRHSQAGSHAHKGWETYTDSVIKILSETKENLVFLLWGNYARAKRDLINQNNHLVLEAVHPSPFSADKGFFGCKHFSKTNKYLKEHRVEEIEW